MFNEKKIMNGIEFEEREEMTDSKVREQETREKSHKC